MYCNEVIRELAVPTDDRDSTALADHLAICASCAQWAKRDAQFDRLWNATRPDEPSTHEWDSVWAQIASSLDALTPAEVAALSLSASSANESPAEAETRLVPAQAAARARPRTWAAIGLIGFAQAAAILVIVALNWQSAARSRLPRVAATITPAPLPSVSPLTTSANPPLTATRVEIEEGSVVVIQFEGSTAKVVDRTPQAATARLEKRLRALEGAHVDDLLLMLNEFESMTKPTVAMKE